MHPDKNKDDPDADKKFMDLTWCKETLMDKKKRKKYNQCGEECVKDMEKEGQTRFKTRF